MPAFPGNPSVAPWTHTCHACRSPRSDGCARAPRRAAREAGLLHRPPQRQRSAARRQRRLARSRRDRARRRPVHRSATAARGTAPSSTASRSPRQPLAHGDLIRLGRSGGAEMVFLLDDAAALGRRSTSTRRRRSATCGRWPRCSRACARSGRAACSTRCSRWCMDSAIEVTGAERGFIMLANAENELEFKLARGRGRVTLPGKSFETSRKIPEEVFSTGQERVVADLLDGDLASGTRRTVVLGIRHVLCTPLRLVRYLDKRGHAERGEAHRRAVPRQPREGRRAVARRAHRARDARDRGGRRHRERAPVPRDARTRRKMEQEMRIAADIQRALLPEPRAHGRLLRGRRRVAAVPLDRRRLLRLRRPARRRASASRSATWRARARRRRCSPRSSRACSPRRPRRARDRRSRSTRVNQALIRRAIESRFATAFYAVASKDGKLALLQRRPQPAAADPQGPRRAAREGRPDPRPLRARHVRGRHDAARARRPAHHLQRRRDRGAERRRARNTAKSACSSACRPTATRARATCSTPSSRA